MLKRYLIGIIVLLAARMAYPESLGAGKKSTMSGYSFSDYKDFQNNWKLITVRYRKDTEEMRFTYANDLAYKTLMSGKVDYPDGAVFAKIGFKTEPDPAFASSAVPSGVRRYQLMVRDSKKHTTTNGWGYALFDQEGLTFPEDQEVQVKACAACHNIIPDRGYVFSQLLVTDPLTKAKSEKARLEKELKSRLTFEKKSVDKLPAAIKANLPTETKDVEFLIGAIAENVFQGTLDEIRPALSLQSAETGRPAVLVDRKGEKFSLIIPEHISTRCFQDGKAGLLQKSIYTSEVKGENKTLHFCYIL